MRIYEESQCDSVELAESLVVERGGLGWDSVSQAIRSGGQNDTGLLLSNAWTKNFTCLMDRKKNPTLSLTELF